MIFWVRRLTAVLVVLLVAGGAMLLARSLAGGGTPAPVRETPTEAGAPATVSLGVAFGAGVHGRMSALALDLARGFRYDPRAADVCAEAVARAGDCPRSSIVGRGKGEIAVEGSYLQRSVYEVGATFYNAPRRREADLGGVALDLYEPQSQLHAVLFGRVNVLRSGPYGVSLRFTGAGEQLSGDYDLTLRRLATALGAERTSGATTYHLLTNPVSCSTTGWAVALSMRSGGQDWSYRGRASCPR